MKKINLVALSVMAFGLAACGGDDNNQKPVVRNPNVHPVPQQPTNNFGGSAAERLVQDLQRQFGNIKTSANGQIGSRNLPAGNHTWQKLYNIIEAEARECMQQRNSCSIDYNWGGYRTIGGLSNLNPNVFRDFLRMEQIQYVDVIYSHHGHSGAIYTLAHSVEQILVSLNSTYAGAANYWSYNTPGWNTGYYYPTYQPYYYAPNGLNVGVGFNNGNFGLNFNLHRSRNYGY